MKTAQVFWRLLFCFFLLAFSLTDVLAQGKPEVNQPLIFEGQSASPLLIYSFMPWGNDAPSINCLQFSPGNNRYFSEHQIDNTTVDLEGGAGRFSYTCLGKTDSNIYVVRTTLVKGKYTTQKLLLFSFCYRKQLLGNDSTAKQPLITLEKFYWLVSASNTQQVVIKGNHVTVDESGPVKNHVEVTIDTPATYMQDNSYPPTGVALSGVQKDWEDADKRFYFHNKPINPRLLDELNGGWGALADGPTNTMAIDVEAAIVAKQFKDTTTTDKGTGFTTSEESYGATNSRSFNYVHLGKTANGVHVLRVIYMENTPFSSILFIRFRVGRGQLLMCLETYFPESYGSLADITIKGNNVKLDMPQRPTPVDEATDTTHTVVTF